VKESRNSVRAPSNRGCVPNHTSAAGDYVTLHVGNKSSLTRGANSGVECSIKPSGVARTHRSAVINIRRIVELRRYANGYDGVPLPAVPELNVSRNG